MKVIEREIKIFSTRKGSEPFTDWLDKLKDVKARAIIRTRLTRVRLGNLGDSKKINSDVYELRIDFGPGYRVYFGLEQQYIVILLLGGTKSTQQRDICKATEYWEEYKRSCGNE